jgi:CRISPR-associated protein Csm2
MPKKIILDFKEDPDLLDKTAKEWAKAIERGTKKTQIRNFYDRVLELQEDIKRDNFENVYPFIKMLNSKVAYGVNRKVVSREFQEMMTQCLNQITRDRGGKEKFDNFQLFFEAVLGFFKGGN